MQFAERTVSLLAIVGTMPIISAGVSPPEIDPVVLRNTPAMHSSTARPHPAERMAQYAPGEIIIKYRYTDPARSRGRGAQIHQEHQAVTDIIARAYNLALKTQKSGLKYRPIHESLIARMEAGNKTETEVLQDISRKRQLRKPHRGIQAQAPPRDSGFTRKLLIKLDDPRIDVPTAVRWLRDPKPLENSGIEIESAYPNYIFTAISIPNDPRFSEQWALQNTGQTGGTPDADIDAPEAWDITQGSSDVVIAVIDTGVDYNHEDLAASIWINEGEVPDNGEDDDGNGYIDDVRGWDFVEDAGGDCAPEEDCSVRDNDPMDVHGHGTYLSGIVAAVTNNGTGIAGIAPDSKVMAVRAGFLTPDGRGSLYDSDIKPAILYAVENGADVINMSFGGGSPGATEDELQFAFDQGVVLIAGAGNDNVSYRFYPAAYDQVVAVSASDHDDVKAGFSNYGSWVDVAAPGVSILSTLPGDTYASLSGTSAACPHVAGLAALLLSQTPGLSQLELKTLLRSTTDAVTSTEYTGVGRINAHAALLRDATPVADLHSSLDDATVTGIIDIAGTANGTVFLYYTTYYGPGVYPNTWSEIATSSSPATDAVLASWDSSEVPDGVYSIRLVVHDTLGHDSEDRVVLTTNNVDLTYPLANDVFRAGESIALNGTVRGASFQSYSVEWGIGESPVDWVTTGVELTNGGNSEVIDGTLAVWDTSLVVDATFATLRMTASFSSYQTTEYLTVYLDPTLKEGWPVLLDALYDYEHGEAMGMGRFEVTVADLNNDCYKEIIVSRAGNPPTLHVFDHTGTPLPNYPLAIDPDGGRDDHPPFPVVGDINQDGYDEIVILRPKYWDANCENPPVILVYSYDGELLDSFPVAYPDFQWQNCRDFSSGSQRLALADLDGNGTLEIIIVGAWAGTVLDNQGNTPDGWPKELIGWVGGTHEGVPSVGNLDGDDDLEIIIAKDWASEPGHPGEYTGRVYAFNFDGSAVPGWPVTTKGYSFSSPSIGDIDGDGENEVVVGFLYWEQAPDEYGVYVYKQNGDIAPGWPQLQGYEVWSNPVLADLDEDGLLEIVVSALDSPGMTFVFRADGSVVDGWPQNLCWYDYYSPVVADITGDGVPDVITNTNYLYGDCSVYAWDSQGNLIEGFPKVTGASVAAPTIVADIDNDGYVELIAASNTRYSGGQYIDQGGIYVWELEGAEDPGTMHWPMFQHDAQHTGRYAALPDCNANWVRDEDDILGGTSADCNGNGVPDECDIGQCASEDCNHNDTPDECEVPPIGPPENDCNGNSTPDDCETNLAPSIIQHPANQTVCIARMATFTTVADGWQPLTYQWRKDGEDIEDATQDSYTIDPVGLYDAGEYDVVVTNVCGSITSEVATLTVIPIADPSTKPAGEPGYEKVRYISMEPGNPGRLTALRVHLRDLPVPFDGFNSTKCWVGQPQQVSENSGKINHQPGWPDFMSANLQGSPHCMDWSTVGTLHVTDDDIVPASQPPGGVFDPAIYDVQAIDCDCDFNNEANYSAPLTITTSKWGDLVGTCAVVPCTPPDGVVNVATDVTACFDKFRNLEGAVLKSRADVEPNLPDWLVNISDCTFVLDAFRGFAYPAAQTPPAPGWPGPDGCP